MRLYLKRDKDGVISRKHGSTHIGTLRIRYGHGFASDFPDYTKLGEVIFKMDEPSFIRLSQDVQSGRL
jgi:hypothetical protein